AVQRGGTEAPARVCAPAGPTPRSSVAAVSAVLARGRRSRRTGALVSRVGQDRLAIPPGREGTLVITDRAPDDPDRTDGGEERRVVDVGYGRRLRTPDHRPP